MFDEIKRRLSSRRFEEYHAEVRRRNSVNLRAFIILGLAVVFTSVVSQLALSQTLAILPSSGLALYYILIAVGYRILKSHNRTIDSWVFYAIQLPVMLLGILMGTVLDPHRQSVTFLLLIMTLPLCILDKPWRVVSYELALIVLFSLMCILFKDRDIALLDLSHIFSFGTATVSITLFILAERFDAVEGTAALLEMSEHDELSGLKNRYALRSDFPSYIGKPLCVAMVDIDLFKDFNDRLGHVVGDSIIQAFSSAFSNEFGTEHCYRYGGDELLVLYDKATEHEFRTALKRCKRRLAKHEIEGEALPISFSCGFVFATPESDSELRSMINDADGLLLRIKADERGQILSVATP
ncbi:MAG: GGDEF domain-containing protein [Atopobiaceae bacterium]|nr:GGDEF domain-containing protein [Atopobiaceae bacterium]